MNEDGTMARMPDLMLFAKEYGLKIITIKDLIAYRIKTESLIKREQEVFLPTQWGNFKLIAYTQKGSSLTHLVLKKGEWEKDEPVLCRVHSVQQEIFLVHASVIAENNYTVPWR